MKRQYIEIPAAMILGIVVSSWSFADEAGTPPIDEYQLALTLTPNLANGRALYLNCISCHGPEGWGRTSGSYPQIAGQLAGVIIKQLEDIRRGNRSNPIMRAFTSPRVLAGAQEIADVAGYVASLPMTPQNGQGREEQIPLLQGQHYRYLKRQFDHIRRGLRRNADKKMAKQIKGFSWDEEAAVLSYTASLKPPPEKLAAAGWINPDFPYYPRLGR